MINSNFYHMFKAGKMVIILLIVIGCMNDEGKMDWKQGIWDRCMAKRTTAQGRNLQKQVHRDLGQIYLLLFLLL